MENLTPWLELKEIRERDGYTRDGLAEASGLSAEYLRLLELGSRKPSPRTIHKLAATLKVPYSVLMPSPREPDETTTGQAVAS